MDISIQEPEQRSSRKRYDRFIVPTGLGLSKDDFQRLVDDWIVPRLVQTLVEQGANYVISRSSEKKPVGSIPVVSLPALLTKKKIAFPDQLKEQTL